MSEDTKNDASASWKLIDWMDHLAIFLEQVAKGVGSYMRCSQPGTIMEDSFAFHSPSTGISDKSDHGSSKFYE